MLGLIVVGLGLAEVGLALVGWLVVGAAVTGEDMRREREKLISPQLAARQAATARPSAIPTRHVEGELILGGSLASIEGSSHLGDRAPA